MKIASTKQRTFHSDRKISAVSFTHQCAIKVATVGSGSTIWHRPRFRGYANDTDHWFFRDTNLIFEYNFVTFQFEDRCFHLGDYVSQGFLARDGNHTGLLTNFYL